QCGATVRHGLWRPVFGVSGGVRAGADATGVCITAGPAVAAAGVLAENDGNSNGTTGRAIVTTPPREYPDRHTRYFAAGRGRQYRGVDAGRLRFVTGTVPDCRGGGAV